MASPSHAALQPAVWRSVGTLCRSNVYPYRSSVAEPENPSVARCVVHIPEPLNQHTVGPAASTAGMAPDLKGRNRSHFRGGLISTEMRPDSGMQYKPTDPAWWVGLPEGRRFRREPRSALGECAAAAMPLRHRARSHSATLLVAHSRRGGGLL